MTNILQLYDYAEQHNIDVDWFSMDQAISLSMPLPCGGYGIAIDPWKVKTVSEEIVILGHELGHCIKGAFYNKYATCDIRQKHENHADKWEIEHLIDPDELNEAMAGGCDEIWSLAEHFGVTEDFMRKVVCWYVHGNLDVEHYMCH